MREWTKRERVAVEAVARRVGGTWEVGDGADVFVVVGGRRVGVNFRRIKRRKRGGVGGGGLRLRGDKVVVRVMGRLRGGVGEEVPGGVVVLVAVTAPIRLPGRMVEGVEERIRILLGRRGREMKGVVEGNGVRIRVVRGGWEGAARVVGLVHHVETDAGVILGMAEELVEVMGKGGKGWWLVVLGGRREALAGYREIYGQMGGAGYEKVVMVWEDGGASEI